MRDVDLAVVLAEPHDQDLLRFGEPGELTARPVPDLLEHPGDGVGLPKYWVKNLTTYPPTYRFGTYPLR